MTNKGKIWLMTALIFSFWACSNDPENINEEITSEDTANVASMDEATVNFTDVITISLEILSDEGIMNGRTQACYTVQETQNQNQVLVSFNGECVGEDGKTRSGDIILSWEGSFQNGDFSYSIAFDGYQADGYGLDGSITTSDLVGTETGFSYSVVVNDGVLSYPDGSEVTYEQDINYDFAWDQSDLQITVDGSITGTNRDGISYVANVQNPIVVSSGCNHAVSGSFSATFNGRPAITVDYGDGTCDNLVTLSRGSQTLIIEIVD